MSAHLIINPIDVATDETGMHLFRVNATTTRDDDDGVLYTLRRATDGEVVVWAATPEQILEQGYLMPAAWERHRAVERAREIFALTEQVAQAKVECANSRTIERADIRRAIIAAARANDWYRKDVNELLAAAGNLAPWVTTWTVTAEIDASTVLTVEVEADDADTAINEVKEGLSVSVDGSLNIEGTEAILDLIEWSADGQ